MIPFDCEVRVPYAHVDKMGVVYYAHYLVYFEMARAALLRAAGLPYTEMENRGVMLPVVEASCQYKKPAKFDDLLRVRISRTEIRGVRIHIEYEVSRNDELLVTGSSDHVCMSPAGKVLKPAPELCRALE